MDPTLVDLDVSSADCSADRLTPVRRDYPWTTRLGDGEVTFRLMTPEDGDVLLALTRGLSERDLLFLRVDITRPEVVERWAKAVAASRAVTVLAIENGAAVGYCSLEHASLLWTRHLGELLLLVASSHRGRGIGAELARQVVALAATRGLQKLVVQMMGDQRGAQELFHALGFIPEAMLHDWVIDRAGRTHDLLVMSREVDEAT